MIHRAWGRVKDVVVHRILGLDDTPHRIAWGVLLGCVIGFTPTLGFQIVLYVTLAALVRANKVSGIPILFISNPATAVPLYFFCWRVGAFVTSFGDPPPESQAEAMRRRLAEADVPEGFWSRMFALEFWEELVNTLLAMGADMWIGSAVLGILTGGPAYFLAYWGVLTYRRRHWPKHRRKRNRERDGDRDRDRDDERERDGREDAAQSKEP